MFPLSNADRTYFDSMGEHKKDYQFHCGPDAPSLAAQADSFGFTLNNAEKYQGMVDKIIALFRDGVLAPQEAGGLSNRVIHLAVADMVAKSPLLVPDREIEIAHTASEVCPKVH